MAAPVSSMAAPQPIPPTVASLVAQPSERNELPRIHGVTIEAASRAGAVFVSASSPVAVTATLGKGLATGQTLQYSTNGGTTWTDVSSGAISGGVNVRVAEVSLASAVTTVEFSVFDGSNRGPVTRQRIELDGTGPSVSLNDVVFNELTGELSVRGAGLYSLLSMGETVASDIRGRLDWSKLRWDTKSDGSAAVTFTLDDVRFARVASDERIVMGLNPAKQANLAARDGYGPGDTVTVSAGFLVDAANAPRLPLSYWMEA
ncbi:MAG: hypothetical protein ACKO38_20065 [Planctomycetota bacterium]